MYFVRCKGDDEHPPYPIQIDYQAQCTVHIGCAEQGVSLGKDYNLVGGPETFTGKNATVSILAGNHLLPEYPALEKPVAVDGVGVGGSSARHASCGVLYSNLYLESCCDRRPSLVTAGALEKRLHAVQTSVVWREMGKTIGDEAASGL